MVKSNLGLRLLDVREAAGPRGSRDWLSISDVSAELHVPDRRLRRYVDRHAQFIETRKTGRKHLVARGSVRVLARIVDLYSEGATARDVDTALCGDRPLRLPTKAKDPKGAEGALANAVLTAANAQQLSEMTRKFDQLQARIGELGGELEQRDRTLRKALMALVDLFQYNENERRLAEAERDRDYGHHHQRIMLALQELLMHQRRRRRWWW